MLGETMTFLLSMPLRNELARPTSPVRRMATFFVQHFVDVHIQAAVCHEP